MRIIKIFKLIILLPILFSSCQKESTNDRYVNEPNMLSFIMDGGVYYASTDFRIEDLHPFCSPVRLKMDGMCQDLYFEIKSSSMMDSIEFNKYYDVSDYTSDLDMPNAVDMFYMEFFLKNIYSFPFTFVHDVFARYYKSGWIVFEKENESTVKARFELSIKYGSNKYQITNGVLNGSIL